MSDRDKPDYPGKPGPKPGPDGARSLLWSTRVTVADELRLERLASAMGCSESEALRRAVAEALERRS